MDYDELSGDYEGWIEDWGLQDAMMEELVTRVIEHDLNEDREDVAWAFFQNLNGMSNPLLIEFSPSQMEIDN